MNILSLLIQPDERLQTFRQYKYTSYGYVAAKLHDIMAYQTEVL